MIKTTHEIKIDIKYYYRVKDGQKTFELRLNDRDYQAGDGIVFICPTQPEIRGVITYLLNYPDALKDGWVAFGFKIEY